MTDNCPHCDVAYVDDDALYCHACGKKRPGAMPMPYTVLLILPDYIANQYGEEYYSAWVKARTPKAAAHKAQLLATEAMPEANDPADFLVVATYSGNHPNLYSGAR